LSLAKLLHLFKDDEKVIMIKNLELLITFNPSSKKIVKAIDLTFDKSIASEKIKEMTSYSIKNDWTILSRFYDIEKENNLTFSVLSEIRSYISEVYVNNTKNKNLTLMEKIDKFEKVLNDTIHRSKTAINSKNIIMNRPSLEIDGIYININKMLQDIVRLLSSFNLNGEILSKFDFNF
jgi:hypothetical protein